MSIYLWKIKDDNLVINLTEVLKYNELKIIYLRDKTDGKLMAHNEFKYIDFIANRDSYCVVEGLNKIDAHIYAVKHSNLPSTYKPDNFVQAAISLCKELNGGVIEDMIDATVAAFNVDAKLVKHIREFMEESSTKITKIEEVQQVMKLTDTLIEMSKTIPEKIEKLLKLRAEYNKKVAGEGEGLRGGGQVEDSYDGRGIEEDIDDGVVEKLN